MLVGSGSSVYPGPALVAVLVGVFTAVLVGVFTEPVAVGVFVGPEPDPEPEPEPGTESSSKSPRMVRALREVNGRERKGIRFTMGL